MKKLTTKGREFFCVSKKILIFTLIFNLIFTQTVYAAPQLVKLKPADIPSYMPADMCGGDSHNPGAIWTECANLLIGKCAVCPAKKSDWRHPRIDVYFSSWAIHDYPKMTLSDGQCATNAGALRFCARKAFPGNKKDGTAYDNYGNETGASDNPRVQLCAYHDPLDGMDTSPGWSPYHWMTPNTGGEDRGRAVGAAVGLSFAAGLPFLVFGGPLLAGVAALVGGLVLAIMANHNHYVFNNLGCVDLPIAKGPPAFCNDCWHTKYALSPMIDTGYGSTFFNPKVELNFCFGEKKDPLATNGVVQSSPILRGEPTQCIVDKATNSITGPNRQVITLSPVGPTYSATKAVNFSYTEAGDLLNDQREFVAKVTTSNPSQICVYMTKDVNGKEVDEVEQGCLPRPGYMPLPLVSQVGTKNIDDDMRISVTFKEGSGEKVEFIHSASNLKDAAQFNANGCRTLNQVTLCAERKCIAGGDASMGSCKTWDNKVCINGYTVAPFVVANNDPDPVRQTPVAAGVVPPNNILYRKGTLYENNVQKDYPEIGNQGDNPLYITPKIKLVKDALIYDNPPCDERDKDGKCIKRNGRVITSDNYFIDNDRYVLRQLTPDEMGMCIHDPEPQDFFDKTKAGTYQYEVPEKCDQIRVEVWGGGAGGTNGGATGDDHGGGAGGYVSALVKAKEGDKFTMVVGAGGKARENAKSSSVSLAGVTFATAGGGTISSAAGNGGAGSCAGVVDECTLQKTGGMGMGGSCRYMQGGSSWDSDAGKYQSSDTGVSSCTDKVPGIPGVGGCAGDACSGSGVAAYSGPGADGRVRASCSHYGAVNQQ